MKQLPIVLVFTIFFIFSGCAILKNRKSIAAIYEIRQKIETLNKKGRFIYYLIPCENSININNTGSSVGSVDYIFLECDSFNISDKIATFNNVNFFKVNK